MHRHGNNGGGKGKHRTETQHSQQTMNFRMLCHADTAGGLIGKNGYFVKNLENQTGCRISVNISSGNWRERVVSVTGDAAVERNISINGPEAVPVSAAQEGLVRVFDRVLELEGNAGVVGRTVGCRLIGHSFHIRTLIGESGEMIDAIMRFSGAKIQILNKKEQLPVCLDKGDELIQIMGGILSVKRALVPVSEYLQNCATGRSSANMFCEVPFDENGADFSSLVDEENVQQTVAFRLLCSNDVVRGVVGRGGSMVRALENETGASITFSVYGSQDRVATVSSYEKRDPVYPTAQIAVSRVFERSMEVAAEIGLILGLCKGTTVTAKIVLTSDELKFLIDEKGQIGADIASASGAEIQLLPIDLFPSIVAEDDKVIQIVGEYFNVKVALFQVTGKLREKFFSSRVSKGKGVACEQYPNSSMLGSSHNEEAQLNFVPETDHLSDLSFPEKMDPLKFKPNLGGPHKLFSNKQINDNMDVNEVTNETVEIEVPEQKIGLVYGYEGTSLAITKASSGAEVIVQDPHPGKNSGKVIISGTRAQIQVAKCLLHAFIHVKP